MKALKEMGVDVLTVEMRLSLGFFSLEAMFCFLK
jgi:hypothetical protein